jgi:hypothetical protein
MNLPPLHNTGYGSQGRRFMDPRDVIYHENDMQWDNTYQFQLSTDVDFSIPTGSTARSNNPFVRHPPLASSVPKNPSLPAISHYPDAFPNQTTVSPPILHDTLGPQTLVPGTNTTVPIQTPVLAPNQVAPIVTTQVTTTGTRPKTPVMSHPLLPPPNPPTDHIITRSETGNSRPIQVQGFVQSVRKSLANTVKNKQEKNHNTRSISK